MADGSFSEEIEQMQSRVSPGTLRHLRVFVSHRWGNHQKIYEKAISALRTEFGDVQDMSLSKETALPKRVGNIVNDLKLSADLAARIFSTDVIVASSKVATGTGRWTRLEITLAAAAYSVPIVFVKDDKQKNHTTLLEGLEKLGGEYRHVELDSDAIYRAIVEMIGSDLIKRQPVLARRNDFENLRLPMESRHAPVLREFPFVLSHHTPRSVQERAPRRARRRNR